MKTIDFKKNEVINKQTKRIIWKSKNILYKYNFMKVKQA